MARILPTFSLTVAQRTGLERICRTPKTEYRLVNRASLVLAVANGATYRGLARETGVARNTIRLWVSRVRTAGLANLRDQPRSGRPPVLSSEARTQLLGLACRAPADEGCADADRWTLDLLVETALRQGVVPSIHRSTIARLLRRGDLKPHRWRMWLHSKDPQFRAKIAAIVPLYLHHAAEVVLCIDEKTSIQALERASPDQRAAPGRAGRREFEYVRHGTLTLFAAREVHSGQVTGWCQPQRRRVEFLAFLDTLAKRYPRGRVHCVLDNLNTHSGPEVTAWLKRHHGRFIFHFTPFHASWLNQVEVWFSILSRQFLRHASFASVDDLEARLLRFIDRYNTRAGPFTWTWKGYPLVA